MAYLMALEFGDDTTARRIKRALSKRSEPRWFGADDDEFGYFFNYGEAWPRGQESALLMVADFMEEGAWSGAFKSLERDRFNAPTVCNVDFPRLGIDEAFNDPEQATLKIRTYVGSSSAGGERTTFRVTGLPSACDIKMLRDGRPYQGWQVIDDSSIKVDTSIKRHRFEIVTGYRPGVIARATNSMARTSGQNGSPIAALRPNLKLRFGDVIAAGRARAAGISTCPCCSGGGI